MASFLSPAINTDTMSSYCIRPGTSQDIPLLRTIEQSAAQRFNAVPAYAWIARQDPISPAQHQDYILSANSWVAIDQEDQAQGFILISRHEAIWHIDELSVSLQAQGLGIGSQLLAFISQEAMQQNIKRITLTTFANLPWNQAYYRARQYDTAQDIPAWLSQLHESECQFFGPANPRCILQRSLP